MNRIKDYKERYWEGLKGDRSFTTYTKSELKTRGKGWYKKIIETFDAIEEIIEHDTFIITYIKDKGYFCVECNGDDEACDLIREMENYTIDHCYNCGEKGKQRGSYKFTLCDNCYKGAH